MLEEEDQVWVKLMFLFEEVTSISFLSSSIHQASNLFLQVLSQSSSFQTHSTNHQQFERMHIPQLAFSLSHVSLINYGLSLITLSTFLC